MSDYLQFTSIDNAVTANLQIFENLARTFTHVLRTAADELVAVGDIADGDLVAQIYVIPGYRNGIPQLDDQGATDKWAKIHERIDVSNRFVIPKPDSSLMAGVTNHYTVQYDADWYESTES